MDDINLDFLKTPPKHGPNNKQPGSPFVFNELDIRFGKKRSKKFELATNIAKVDELVQKIDQLKSRNFDLQQQLKGFQATAQEVQELYIKEKNGHFVARQDLEKLQKEHAVVDANLTNMTLVNEQLKARLDEYDGRPISFENLVVKYVKVMTKLQEDDLNKYSQDKVLLEILRGYCKDMNYKVPRANSPKKSRPRANKPQMRETPVQCDLFGNISLKTLDCSSCKSKAKLEDQGTQCSITKRDQSSQYISTMVTRQTNTENIAQKHVQTMFPEPPAIDEIIKVYANWSNIRSVSPLLETPPRNNPHKGILKSQSTIGTCTMLCNVRRKIDYLVSNNSSNIKQEFFTPSASPTPNTDSATTSGSRVNSLSNNMTGNINSNSLLNSINSTTNSTLGELSYKAFNEVWQIFGRMLLSLIQNSNAGTASTNQSSNINQQQFLDWLLELYTNSKATSDTIHTQTLEQRATNDSINPLIFNSSSVLSTDILRPQPQKPFSEGNVNSRNESIKEKQAIRSNLIDYTATNVPSGNASKISINNEIQQQQTTSNTNKSHTTDIQENNKNCRSKLNKKEKVKHKILNEIEELLPGIKLNKKKRKVLKRLLKSNCHQRKSHKTRNNKNPKVDDKEASVVTQTNEYNVEDTTETAIDILRTFSAPEQNNQPIEEYFSETERMLIEQVPKKTLNYSKSIENKYQLLFGESDDEESNNFQLQPKPVIKSNVDENALNSNRELCIPDIPTPVLEDLHDIIQFPDSDITCTDDNLQNLNPSLIINSNTFVNFESSLANDLGLHSDACAKEVIDIAAHINEISKTDAKIEETYIKKDTTEPHKVSNLQDSTIHTVECTVGASCNSLPQLNEDDYSITSVESQPVIISSTTMYSSDFEKDFELSSDNESLSNENYISKTNESPKVKSFCEGGVTSHTPAVAAAEQTSNLNTLGKEYSKSKEYPNILLANNEEKNSVNEFEPKNDGIPYLSPNKEKSQQETSRISCMELNASNELQISKPSCKTIFNINQADSETCETKEASLQIRSGQKNLIPVNDDIHISLSKTTDKKTFNNHKEKLNSSLTSCLPKSSVENTTITNTQIRDSRLKLAKNCIKETILQKSNNTFEEQNCCTEDLLHHKQVLTPSSNILSQSPPDMHTIVDSSASSIITVSDSSASDEVLNSKEILKASNEKDLCKTSGLGSLKLLHLNNTFSLQKPGNNVRQNVLQDDINSMSTEESSPLKLGGKETVTTDTIAKRKNENCNAIEGQYLTFSSVSFSTENILERKTNANTSDSKCQKYNSDPLDKKTRFEESFFTNNSSAPNNKVPIQYVAVDEADKSDLSDSLSMEDELMIDEKPIESTSKLFETNPLEISFTETGDNCNDVLDSSNISTLLNSSLYNEVLTESLNPIVEDLLQEDLIIAPAVSEAKSKRSRKRKSDCLSELQPCKRSQRLKAKQMILEESLNLSTTQEDFTQCQSNRKNVFNSVLQRKSPQKEDSSKKVIAAKTEILQNTRILGYGITTQLGFFRERDAEEEKASMTNKTISITNTQALVETERDKTYTICENTSRNLEEHEKQKQTLNQNISKVNKLQKADCPDERPSVNFIYTDSPQSPPPIETLECNHVTETYVNIPLERPAQFAPQNNNLNIFDALIKSYKNEHQKQVLESISLKELNRKECILKQLKEQIMLYCNDEMELDLYCTSTRLINKLLNLSPDYNLMQKAVIVVAKQADSLNVGENDLPSTIQEMPPRHLSKCLQRLFTFLRIIVTRNSSFCHDLIDKIENLLFNNKQVEKLSLQDTLNLTQLYLMASKVQEYLQTPKHSARLFIAKCIYYYIEKSVLMIHEVLLWYPTVLPHREDKTYNRSDALISVIQQILMNTKYDMDKQELRGKLLISKLRYEYHFEAFKPSQEEVVSVLVEKLKHSKFYNISLAFALLCKRIGVKRTQNIVLGQHLMPLANEYYSLALKTSEYDKRIEVLLEIISMIVKPLPIETETKIYFCEFARFLNGFERQTIQEAALCSILRLQRFNVEYCYSLLSHFQPTYTLNAHTQAMLKTFLYRRPLKFWKGLNSKNIHTYKF